MAIVTRFRDWRQRAIARQQEMLPHIVGSTVHSTSVRARLRLVLAGAVGTGSLLLAAVGAAPLAYASAQPTAGPCVDPRADVLSIQQSAPGLYSEGFAGTPSQGITGIFTLPTRTPDSLVVMAHGHHNSSASWQRHALDARDHGAVGVAVDYRGLGAAPGYTGWPARAGAEDLVSAARYFISRCPSIKRVVLVGVSMGGNMSGMAMAADATRPGTSKPLFDYWVDVEGVNNWLETYAEAAATQNMAQGEIEAECGGQTPLTAPDCYRQRTVTARVPDIAASGVRGIDVVHSVEDGLVPSDQSREFVSAARPAGLAVDMYNVLRRSSDPSQSGQTTLIGDADPNADCTGGGSGAVGPLPSAVAFCDPFAGHGWEGSETQLTVATGMNLAWNLISRDPQQPANRECVVDAGAVMPLGTDCAPGAGQASPPAAPGHRASASPASRATSAAAVPRPEVTGARAVAPAPTSHPRSAPRPAQGFFAALAAAFAEVVRAVASALSA